MKQRAANAPARASEANSWKKRKIATKETIRKIDRVTNRGMKKVSASGSLCVCVYVRVCVLLYVALLMVRSDGSVVGGPFQIAANRSTTVEVPEQC